MNTETKVEIKLFDWLIRNGVEVYFNRTIKELNNKNIFTTTQKEKPDLVLYSHKLKKYIAVEVKVARLNRNIYDANKIINYNQEYSNKENKYFIYNQEIEIYCFIIATENSEKGTLFYEDDTEIPRDEKWHKILQELKCEPPREFKQTKSYLRNLWSVWRNKKQYNRKPFDSGIGILLSNRLDNFQLEQFNPKIFAMIYDLNKKRWVRKWQEI